MYTNSLTKLIFIGTCLLFSSSFLQGDVITLEQPSKDNTIFEEGILSNGAGVYLFAGKTGTRADTQWRRALIQFDVSSIPAGSTINSATLSMHVSKKPATDSGSRVFNIHFMTRDWGEGTSNAGNPGGSGAPATTGDATWANAFHPSTPWTSDGADLDFVSTASASQAISGTGAYSWSSAELAADVQAWVNNPESNFGWIILGPNVDQTARRFDSRENTVADNRPKLTIDYTPPPPPPTHWAGYPIEADGRTVDTMNYMGLIDIASDPWIYVYDMQSWIYMPESHLTEAGGWLYVPK